MAPERTSLFTNPSRLRSFPELAAVGAPNLATTDGTPTTGLSRRISALCVAGNALFSWPIVLRAPEREDDRGAESTEDETTRVATAVEATAAGFNLRSTPDPAILFSVFLEENDPEELVCRVRPRSSQPLR